MTRLTCPDCGLPLRVDTQGCKPARVRGELVFTSTMTLVTCDTMTCARNGITREVAAFYHMTAADVKRYNRQGVAS